MTGRFGGYGERLAWFDGGNGVAHRAFYEPGIWRERFQSTFCGLTLVMAKQARKLPHCKTCERIRPHRTRLTPFK